MGRFFCAVGLVWTALTAAPWTVSPAIAATPDERLVDAAAAQQTELMRGLLRKGVDVNTRRADGVTALLWAAHWDDVSAVDLLLHSGAKARTIRANSIACTK